MVPGALGGGGESVAIKGPSWLYWRPLKYFLLQKCIKLRRGSSGRKNRHKMTFAILAKSLPPEFSTKRPNSPCRFERQIRFLKHFYRGSKAVQNRAEIAAPKFLVPILKLHNVNYLPNRDGFRKVFFASQLLSIKSRESSILYIKKTSG